ncbi:MAG: phosphodiester glycosidase family protein, partial [Oscillospiraceae bacterium]|nr:phosphodiester glycosidase family protein [Oscillospiraceae bacterium]
DKKLNNTVPFSSLTSSRKPIAAVNGNFFNAYDAIKDPIGHLMIDGEFLYASSGITSIGFMNDNSIMFGMPAVFTDIYTTDNDGDRKAETCTVYEINVQSQKGNQAILYTPARGSSMQITDKGMIIEVIDSTVTRHYNVNPGDTATIPSNGYILYFNEQVTQLDYFKPVSIGRKVAIRYRLFKDDEEGFDLANSRFILSGAPRLVKNGAIDTTPLPSGFAGDNRFSVNSAPRTAAGKLSDGKLILVSASSTIAELKEIMLQLGCTDAVNIDGGASAAMYYNGSILRSPGRELTSIFMIVEK